MQDYRSISYWLATAGDDLTPRPPLDGSVSVDVAILGAGFTGLWTAYHLLQREPSLRVAVVEEHIAGYGASGRNGGWCFSGFPYPLTKLADRHGPGVARAVQQAMNDSVDDVGRVCQAEDIDAHYVKSGALEIARSPLQWKELEEQYEGYRQLGLEDYYDLLDAGQTEEHLRVAGAVGSLWNKEGAAVQPARLARGLARAVERHGGTIYEQTRVLDFAGRPSPRLMTARGDVLARAIVLAGEAYLARLSKLRRQILPLYSHIVLTEPLSADQWAQIGWERREVVGAGGGMGGYLNKTVDGRIAFGPYRAPYNFGSRIDQPYGSAEDIFAHGRAATLDWFPMLKDVRFTDGWGGVFGMPRDRMPTMSYDRATGIASGRGYTGEGVATSNLSGRVLADLLTETESPLTTLPMVGHHSPDWPPEPLRWLGVTYVKRKLQQISAEAERTGRYPEKPTLAQRLWSRS